MEKFIIELSKEVRQDNNMLYVEFIPKNEYNEIVKKCDTIPVEKVSDYVYLESVKVEFYNFLTEIYGKEFTDKYEL
jgi:hypothetical protein